MSAHRSREADPVFDQSACRLIFRSLRLADESVGRLIFQVEIALLGSSLYFWLQIRQRESLLRADICDLVHVEAKTSPGRNGSNDYWQCSKRLEHRMALIAMKRQQQQGLFVSALGLVRAEYFFEGNSM
jgi:hypothetical protein